MKCTDGQFQRQKKFKSAAKLPDLIQIGHNQEVKLPFVYPQRHCMTLSHLNTRNSSSYYCGCCSEHLPIHTLYIYHYNIPIVRCPTLLTPVIIDSPVT